MSSDPHFDPSAPGVSSALAARAAPPWRRLIVTMGTTAYVCAAAVLATGGRGLRVWAMVLVSLAVAYSAARRKGRAAGIATWGFAVVIASLGAAGEHRWLTALGSIGALACACAARWSLANVVATPGLAAQRARSPWPGMVALGALWGVPIEAAIAASAAGARARPMSTFAREEPAWATMAAGLTLLLLLASGWWVAHRRALEMGVASRVWAAMSLTATTTILACAAGYIHLEQPENVGRLAVGASSVLIVWIALHGDGVRIARTARRALVLAFAGGTAAMLGASVAEGRPWDAAMVTVLTATLTLVIGAAARVLEDPLRPAQGRWLDAAAKAHQEVMRSDPDDAVRQVLITMRAPAGAASPTPELWTFAPTRVATIDAAGYVRERDAEMLPAMIAVAAAEPEATLRSEVLDALVVRRPDLRALARFMDQRAAMTATIVTRGGEPDGLLVVPRGDRIEPLSLEEARAIKHLADSLASVCHARGVERRTREREHELVLRADHAEEKIERLRHDLELNLGRHALATQRLARPATVGIYSAASRTALDALERRTAVHAPIAVVAPSGIDPVPYLARAHLSGPRSASPLVLVDGTSSREHDVARWTDARTSPLALADGGMLVLLDGAALPLDVQRLVARALTEKRPPWERAEPLDVSLAVTSALPLADLVESGRLDPMLATRLGDAMDAPATLLRLCDRPEDIRAIMTDRLAREGLRVKGTPVGIESAAYGRLVEYGFPGEEAEVAAIVQRLVARCSGEVVRAADVDALGLAFVADTDAEAERENGTNVEKMAGPKLVR